MHVDYSFTDFSIHSFFHSFFDLRTYPIFMVGAVDDPKNGENLLHQMRRNFGTSFSICEQFLFVRTNEHDRLMFPFIERTGIVAFHVRPSHWYVSFRPFRPVLPSPPFYVTMFHICLIWSNNSIWYLFDSICSKQGDRLDSGEQRCLASCQDQYLEIRNQVQQSLEQRQANGMM